MSRNLSIDSESRAFDGIRWIWQQETGLPTFKGSRNNEKQ